MKETIFIPNLGLTMEDVVVAELLKKEGEYVKEGDVVLTIETDESLHDIEAPINGIKHYDCKKEETYKVGQTIGWVSDDGN